MAGRILNSEATPTMIDCEIKQLCGKFVAKTATGEDRRRYEWLMAERRNRLVRLPLVSRSRRV